jgi:Lar family restriction alleviation protein
MASSKAKAGKPAKKAPTMLKPCPFCGTSQWLCLLGTNHYWVHCEECGTEGPYKASKFDARAAWNRRAKPDAQAARRAGGKGP